MSAQSLASAGDGHNPAYSTPGRHPSVVSERSFHLVENKTLRHTCFQNGLEFAQTKDVLKVL